VKLELIREIGLAHMRVLEGLDSFLQMSALVAKLCMPAVRRKAAAAQAASRRPGGN
jgi:replication factor C subunit 2/4